MRCFPMKPTSIAMAMAAFALPAAASPYSEAQKVFDPVGASGDHEKELRCPEGQIVTGLNGRVGSWIDQLQIVCAPQDEEGRALAPAFTSEAVGGMGGQVVEGHCFPGHFFTKVDVFLTSDMRMVREIRPFCGINRGRYSDYQSMELKLLNNGGPMTFGGQATGPIRSDTHESWKCVDRIEEVFRTTDRFQITAVTGFVVRYGKHINGLGMRCDVIRRGRTRAELNQEALDKAADERDRRKAEAKAEAERTTEPLTNAAVFAGGWSLVTAQGGHFDLILEPTEIDPLTGAIKVFRGTLINRDGPDGHRDLDGGLRGTVVSGRTLYYELSQPGLSSGGTGVFTLSEDGTRIDGEGVDTKAGSYTWGGPRKN